MTKPTLTTERRDDRSPALEILFAADVGAGPSFNPTAQSVEPRDGVFINPRGKFSLMFFGTGEVGQMAMAFITGWRLLPEKQPLWIPSPLMTLNLTFGPMVGADGCAVDAKHRFVNTIAPSSLYAPDARIISPDWNNFAPAEVRLSCPEMRLIQVTLSTCGGDFGVNCLLQKPAVDRP